MCGAFATRPPSGPNSAHEKSSRSLMFTEMDVRWPWEHIQHGHNTQQRRHDRQAAASRYKAAHTQDPSAASQRGYLQRSTHLLRDAHEPDTQ